MRDASSGVPRVVSLVPSVTETLTSLGVTPVACTRFCERDDLVHVGGTKDPDLDAIAALEPEIVILDSEENRIEDYEALTAMGLTVHATSVRSLEDVDRTVTELAHLVGTTWVPREPCGAAPVRTTAFVPIWRRPWMALGTPTYASSLLEHLGVANVLADLGPYPAVELDDVIARRPDVVLAPSEPYPFSRRQLPELERVAPTVFVDGKDLFWWGVRTAAATHRLRAVIDAR